MTLVIGVMDTADWDCAEPENIRQVCLSVAHCFDGAIAERALEPIRIEPSFLDPPRPRTRFDRLETGQVRIMLSARGRDWAKFAYQFAHEFCHVLTNIRPPAGLPIAWIEESLCQASSVFALRAMAHSWRDAPPYPNWANYAETLAEWATKLADPKHGLPAGVTFAEWLVTSLPVLQQTGYAREHNDVVASQLLPIFEAEPETWRAVRYLNLWSTIQEVTFASYFATWRSVTPHQHHEAVNRIEHCLTAQAGA